MRHGIVLTAFICFSLSYPTSSGAADPPPGACGAAIDQVQTALDRARVRGQSLRSLPESVGAKLHHQPTARSLAAAEDQSADGVAHAIDAARALRSAGKRSECIETLQKKASLGGSE
jgi:hypothetical protein